MLRNGKNCRFIICISVSDWERKEAYAEGYRQNTTLL